MNPPPNYTPLARGTPVKILHSGYKRAYIAEYRGPLGPRGAHIYSIQVQRRPRPDFIEVREDQLEILDTLPNEKLPSA